MEWDRRQARCTLLLFLLVFAAGQVKAFLGRPVYPDPWITDGDWPPAGRLVDATALAGRALEVFPTGITVAEALSGMGLAADRLGSGRCLPRAGTLVEGQDGWRIRSMTQRERWVWRIPMELYRCEPDDLVRIRGVGPALAGKIHRFVRHRGYLNSIDDLEQVPGIGPVKLKALRKDLEIP